MWKTETDVILNGAKMWISNSPFAEIAVVWAKNEEGRIHGLIVERGMEGFSTPTMKGKWSLRASDTGELIFDNVRVPKANILPEKSGLGAPLGCLDSARFRNRLGSYRRCARLLRTQLYATPRSASNLANLSQLSNSNRRNSLR